METDGRHLDYPCLTIRQSLKGKALEIAQRIERESLKGKTGSEILMEKLSQFYGRDRDSEKLEKATAYFSARRKKGGKC